MGDEERLGSRVGFIEARGIAADSEKKGLVGSNTTELSIHPNLKVGSP